MKTVLTIAGHHIRNLYRNSIFWIMLLIFPLAELLLFSRLFRQPSAETAPAAVQLLQLNPLDVGMSFRTMAIIVLGQFLMIGSVIAASLLIKEKEQRTMMRVLTFPVTKSQLFLGYMLALTVQICLTTVSVLLLGHLFFGIQWAASLPSLALVSLLSILLSASLGFFISTIFSSGNMAGGVMSGVVILMTFLNGDMTNGRLIFPHSDLLTINKWIKTAFVGISQGVPLSQMRTSLAVIAALIILFTSLSILLFRKERLYE